MALLCGMLSESWNGHSLFGASGFGGEFFPEEIKPDAPEGAGYGARVGHAALSLIDGGAEMLALLGGDGTAAYVADAMIRSNRADIPIFGIAMGTANVGPIISHDALKKGLPAVERLQSVKAGAVEAFDGERRVSYGFNDIVIGDTLLATLDGETITADAALLAKEGRIERREPGRCIAERVTIRKNGVLSETSMAAISQIIASPVDRDDFYGRAVTGILCHSPHTPDKAAILFSPHPIVTMAPDDYGFKRPARSETMLFGEDDAIVLSGIDKEALIIADGNPFLRGERDIRLRYMPEIVTIAIDGRYRHD